MPRETEEEMMAKVIKMQGGDVDNDNKVDNKEDKEVEGVQLEQAGTNIMPRAPQETGLKSEKDDKDKEKVKDDDDEGEGDDHEDPDKVITQGKDSPEDILTVANANKRVKDAQTKMHQKASEASETKALLETANLKVQSYESIITKSGVNSTEGIKAQQDIDETKVQTVADLQALEKEYPEIAKPLISAFSRMQVQLDSMKKDQAASVESMNESNESMLNDMHFKRVGEFHPDYLAISKSQEFTDWVNGLSPFERSAALIIKADGDADESISMLDKFKEDTGYGGNGNNNNIVDDETRNANNLKLAKSKVSPTFNKKKDLKLQDNTKQLAVADMRRMKPTKENEDRILQAMATGNLIS